MNTLFSEDDFLALIDRHFPKFDPRVLVHRGDDAAVIACPDALCLTTDLFLEDIHFRRAYFSAGDIGYKGLAVNLSDIAAMGAHPTGFSLGLMVPPGLDEPYFDELFAAMAELAEAHDVPLVGGDLNRAPILGLAITVWGEAPKRFTLRGQARPGDLLFTAGAQGIGLARAGLHVLEQGTREPANREFEAARFPAAVRAHLRPALDLPSGPALAAISEVRGLMDVSDGLARDLPRFLKTILAADLPQASGHTLGADLHLAEASLHPEAVAAARLLGRDPVEWAVLGGEDYVLLGCCPPDAFARVQAAVPSAMAIGAVLPKPDLLLNGKPLAEKGFDHFAE